MTLLALLLVLPQGDYDGHFAEHSSYEYIAEAVGDTARDAGEGLPKWLGKRAPRVEVTLSDLEQPLERHVWPGAIHAEVEIAREEDEWRLTLEVPIDTFIAHPPLARDALERQIFAASSTARAMELGVDRVALPAWGMENPLVEAIASHWAGTLDTEIEFVLRRHLVSDEELASLVVPIVAPDGGGFAFERKGGDDLTWHVLVRMLAPKESDKRLGKLYSALEKGQTFEAALKKASGKTLERVNEELLRFYVSYVKKRFPTGKMRERFRRALVALETEDWGELVDALSVLQQKDAEFLRPYVPFFLARALEGVGGDAAESANQYLDVCRFYVECDLGPEAMQRAAAVLRQDGKGAAADDALEFLQDDYRWLASVRK